MAEKKSLIIVESPTKAKTIQKYVGDKFVVAASKGHVKDLPKTKLGVDLKNNFQPQYILIKDKEKIVEQLKKAAKGVKSIYLAADPDREGEAIAWHVSEILASKNISIYRVLFNEITKASVQKGIANPTELNSALYDAQRARRVLDRLVGYQISPILWKKVKRGLSAGRVQSVAVRLICERESEINAFKPEEYWLIDVLVKLDDERELKLRLSKIDGKKNKVSTAEQAAAIAEELKGATITITDVKRKKGERRPSAPFITSTLQQEAARRYRFPVVKTMIIAQQLYEGIEIKDVGAVGLITYMRTDSVRVSDEAVTNVRTLIKQRYGDDFLPKNHNVFKNKRQAQDAHEAIRPTLFDLPPEAVHESLDRDQQLIYQLIWDRFVASQMTNARLNRLTISADALDKYTFSADFEEMVFPGFRKVYEERVEDDEKVDELPSIFPEVKENEVLKISDVQNQQKFTKPPARYTESSLVRELESKGIGRPSTYASIVSTIKDKHYVTKEKGYFHPTELGETINRLLTEHFPEVMDVKFTAIMESELDKVEDGEVDWTELLKNFYALFESRVKHAQERMRNVRLEQTSTGVNCEKCGATMVIRWGKKGKFLACPNYPRCRNTKEYISSSSGNIKVVEEIETEEPCEKCGRNMVVRVSKRGRFLACPGYPECRNSKPLSHGISCPKNGCDGKIVERRSRRSGNPYYVCTKYPDCDFLVWDFPVKKTCPKCGTQFMLLSRDGEDRFLRCAKEDCSYEVQIS